MDFYDLMQNHAAVFLLLLTRVSGLFIVAPFFGSMNVPQTIRVGAAVAISFAIFPLVDGMGVASAPETVLGFAVAVVRELFVGWLIGFVAFVSFAAINMAGKMMDMQVGFSIVNVMDPTSGQQIPLIGSFLYNLGLIVFVVTNGHHALISALVGSFRSVPLMMLSPDVSLVELIARFTVGIFTTGVQISIPVTFAVLMTNVGLGILARTMPQLNIFVVGVPMHIIIGLGVLFIVIPFYVLFLDVLFNAMYGNITAALRVLG
ncbi:MAG: flagellar type III secretion system protein FliR [Selenomonadaceae bacterium]|nr:flagellar type III secretion system protein FliR [Selenomonadaceae bacterium]